MSEKTELTRVYTMQITCINRSISKETVPDMVNEKVSKDICARIKFLCDADDVVMLKEQHFVNDEAFVEGEVEPE